MNNRTDEDNDGRFPAGVPILTPFPVSDQEIAGARDSWPWVAATVLAQCGPDEWSVVIEDERATTTEAGTGESLHPIVFRDGSEIRLPDPTVEELRQVFSGEHGGAL